MYGRELLTVVPLAVFEQSNVPDRYSNVPPGFEIDTDCAIGKPLTVVPLLGRVRPKGIYFHETDEASAAALGSAGIGWIGHVDVNEADVVEYSEAEMAGVASSVRLKKIVPYCTDRSARHNNIQEELVAHIRLGPAASEGRRLTSHKHPRTRGVLVGQQLLLPHCGRPSPEEPIRYGFRTEGAQLIFSPRA